jgi:hypothetical protein
MSINMLNGRWAALSSAATLTRVAPIGGADIRVLVALEDDYRAYRETIAAVLRVLRPGAEVRSTPP